MIIEDVYNMQMRQPTQTHELDEDNIMSALKGEEITLACVNCKHYVRFYWFEPFAAPKCHRERHSSFHPVTGKPRTDGNIWDCNAERVADQKSKSNSWDPCGREGKWFQSKDNKED